jgi:cytoskeletal protein RodZ
MNELLKNFGDELKSLREEKGISLQQVYNKIRIDVKFLSAIEAGNFDILPELYIRAFIKEYALYLNLDVNETIKKYDQAKKGLSASQELTSSETPSDTPVEPKVESEPFIEIPESNLETKTISLGSIKLEKKKFLSALTIAIVFLIAGSVAVYLFIDSSPKIIDENSDNEINNATESRYEEIQKPALKETTSQFSTDSLTLSISSTKATWIKVSSDRKEIFREILTPENPIEIKADTLFEISVQFPAVLIAKLNGKNLGVLASGNELWHLKIDSTGVFKSFKIVNTKNDTGN